MKEIHLHFSFWISRFTWKYDCGLLEQIRISATVLKCVFKLGIWVSYEVLHLRNGKIHFHTVCIVHEDNCEIKIACLQRRDGLKPSSSNGSSRVSACLLWKGFPMIKGVDYLSNWRPIFVQCTRCKIKQTSYWVRLTSLTDSGSLTRSSLFLFIYRYLFIQHSLYDVSPNISTHIDVKLETVFTQTVILAPKHVSRTFTII